MKKNYLKRSHWQKQVVGILSLFFENAQKLISLDVHIHPVSENKWEDIKENEHRHGNIKYSNQIVDFITRTMIIWKR